jgi:hypothetical protein
MFISIVSTHGFMTVNAIRAPKQIVRKYWQEILRRPKDENPAWDNDGQKDMTFNNEVNDEFFYLSFLTPSGSTSRTCVIPPGKRLFIPVSSVEVSEYEAPQARGNERQLRSLALNDQNAAMVSLSVELDDETLQNINDFNEPSGVGPFSVSFPPSNAIFPGSGPRNCQAIAAGRYLVLESLSPGNHKLRFKSVVKSPNDTQCIEQSFHEDVTYNLTVT